MREKTVICFETMITMTLFEYFSTACWTIYIFHSNQWLVHDDSIGRESCAKKRKKNKYHVYMTW